MTHGHVVVRDNRFIARKPGDEPIGIALGPQTEDEIEHQIWFHQLSRVEQDAHMAEHEKADAGSTMAP